MALRASNPIQASASSVFGWVGLNVKPADAFAGSSFEMGPANS